MEKTTDTNKLPAWHSGDDVTPSRMNAMQTPAMMLGRGRATVTQFPDRAATIYVPKTLVQFRYRSLGIITDKGPNNEADYTGCQYWVKIARCTNPASDAPTEKLKGEAWPADSDFGGTITATNWSERLNDTHQLTVGSFVIVECILDAGPAQGPRYYIRESVGGGVTVTLGVDSSSDPSGVYKASTIEIGMTDGADCIVYNSSESGIKDGSGAATLHLLDLTVAYPGVSVGIDSGSGKLQVLISVPPPQDVTITGNTGSNGSVSGSTVTNATYAYTFTSRNGDTIGTNIQPIDRGGADTQTVQGILTGPATLGRVAWAADGTMSLVWVNESASVTGCSSSGSTAADETSAFLFMGA